MQRRIRTNAPNSVKEHRVKSQGNFAHEKAVTQFTIMCYYLIFGFYYAVHLFEKKAFACLKILLTFTQ